MANESGVLAMRFMNTKKGKKSWAGKSKDYLDSHSYDSARRIGTELEREILDVMGKCDQKKKLPLVSIVINGSVCLAPKNFKAI